MRFKIYKKQNKIDEYFKKNNIEYKYSGGYSIKALVTKGDYYMTVEERLDDSIRFWEYRRLIKIAKKEIKRNYLLEEN